MTNQTIPKRSEVPEEMTWNLKDMFASDEAWMTEYEAMKAFPAKIAAFRAPWPVAPGTCWPGSGCRTRSSCG